MTDDKASSVASKRLSGPPPAPRLVGDQIIFYCPNGDRIVVAAALAGKKGLCTKCKEPVAIPAIQPEQPAPDASGAESAAPSPEDFAFSVPGQTGGPAGGGPASPAFAAEPVAAAPPVDWDIVSDQAVAAVIPELAGLGANGPAQSPLAGLGNSLDHHPAARLVARLWQERAHGGVIELHLAGGSVILPQWYEVNWSSGTHGLFASQAADGTVTMTAIAWDTLEKIVVRQVRDLPEGFE